VELPKAKLVMAQKMSLHSVIAILILSTDTTADPRIFAKYYSPPHTSASSPTPVQPYPNVKEQKAFEKGLLEKTAKTVGFATGAKI
jgi:coatomer subunit zeta